MNISPSSITEQYKVETQSEDKLKKELGQKEFLELMMAQLKNQDPMEPMDNGEFLGQMAQFSAVTGIDDMKVSLDKLNESFASGQTLQATQLVGQEVLVENRGLELTDGQPTGGLFELESPSTDVKLTISDSTGSVVRQMTLGSFAAGRHEFEWDGIDDNNDRSASGQYTATITALRGDEYLSTPVLTRRMIDSVEFGRDAQTILNTRRGDELSLSDIRQIRNAPPAN